MENAAILISAIVFFAVIALILFQKGKVNFLIAKKIVHITTISLTAISPYFVPSQILIWFVIALTLIILILTYLGLFQELNNNRKTWGVFYFSAIFLLLIYLFPNQPDLVFYPMIVLALADGLAAVVGSKFGKHKYAFSGEVKSMEGSLVFFMVSVFCFWAVPKVLPFVELSLTIHSAIFISIFLTLLEAQSTNGRDNFWIPLGALYWLLIDSATFDFQYVLLIGSFSVAVYTIYKFRWLSAGGAITTWLLGCILVASPDPVWVIPALVFLALGSMISKLPQKDKLKSHAVRTGQQVFCNGGIYTLFVGAFFISSDVVYLLAAMASVTAAMSDTASSELGRRYGKRTVNILNFRKVPAGLSGGVSFVGSVSGAVFAIAMAGLPFLILPEYTREMFAIVLVAGIAGNIADSFIGALYQIKYRPDSKSPWSDIPVGNGKNQTKGIVWITNNTVNLFATATAGFIGFIAAILL